MAQSYLFTHLLLQLVPCQTRQPWVVVTHKITLLFRHTNSYFTKPAVPDKNFSPPSHFEFQTKGYLKHYFFLLLKSENINKYLKEIDLRDRVEEQYLIKKKNHKT